MIEIIQAIREIILIILYPFANFIPLPSDNNPKHPKKTIVFVERWFNANPFHKVWQHYLRKQGFATYGINIPIFKGSFEESAQTLKEFIEEKKLQNIILVGISGGGITSLVYLQEDNGWEKVEKLITLGTPLKGTLTALFISFTKSGRQLLPGSTLIKKIASEQILHPEKITTISAKFDEMVPFNNSTLPHVKHITLKIVGHNNFHLDSKKTYEEIIKITEK